jgi:hypothetical protein
MAELARGGGPGQLVERPPAYRGINVLLLSRTEGHEFRLQRQPLVIDFQ